MQTPKMGLFEKAQGVTLRDKMRSSEIR